jgi:hypothetical protein
VGVANIVPVSSGGQHGGQIAYDKMRNSYQNPNGSYDIVGQSSFHNQKSPKVSGSTGIKHIKISGNQNMSSGLGGSKNVRIMLVGNNGIKNQQSFKANIVDGMSYVSGAALPKTTKNNMSKFYSNGQQDLSGGFLNALSTPQNKQNSFRQDGLKNGIGNVNMRQSANLSSSHNQGYSSVQFQQREKSRGNQ